MLGTLTAQSRDRKQPVLQGGNRVPAPVQIPALPFTIWVSWSKLGLSFLNCKIGIVILTSLRVIMRTEDDS